MPEADDGRRQDTVQIRFPRFLLPRLPVFDRNDVGDERRNLRRAGQDQDEGHGSRQGGEQFCQQAPGPGVQADIGIVHHQDFRTAQEGARELILAELARRKRHQGLVQQRFHREQGGQFLHPPERGLRVFAFGRILVQRLPHGRRVAFEREEIPALLHKEIAVPVAAVRIPEGDVFRGVTAGEDRGQPAFAGGILSHQGDLFSATDIQTVHRPYSWAITCSAAAQSAS